MRCPKGHIVNNTDRIYFILVGVVFLSSRRCNGQNVMKSFEEKCISRGYKLITTEEEWKIGTK